MVSAGLAHLEAGSHTALVEASNERLARCVQAGERAVLIVPSHAWGEQRKLQLRGVAACGIEVVTCTQWVVQLWDSFGDGTRVVTDVQRCALLRPLLQEVTGSTPSQGFLAQYARAAAELLACPSQPTTQLSSVEQRLIEQFDTYRSRLAEHGFIDPVQAQQALATLDLPYSLVVVEEPDARCIYQQRFFEQLAEKREVLVIERTLDDADDAVPEADELAQLHARLFTGRGGLPVRGAVLAAEAHGTHIQGACIVRIVQRLVSEGVATRDIALVFASAADAYPHVLEALAEAQIPFESSFAVGFATTAFGCAFLESFKADGDDPAVLADLAATPYAGLSAHDAQALQTRWRAQAWSTPEQRLRDIREGFASGNVSQTQMRDRLAPLARLLEEPAAQRAQLMFDNARARHPQNTALVDDAQAANALLAYLDACMAVGAEPSSKDAAVLSVNLARSFGAPEEALVVGDFAQSALYERSALIIADLDVDHHPMARRAGSFDDLLAAYGIAAVDDEAQRQRVALLDALEAAHGPVALMRCCSDVEGNGRCQSALWDELMAAYRTAADAGKPPETIPRALEEAGCALRLSEAQVFAQVGNPDSEAQRMVERGQLDSSEPAALLQKGDGTPRSFSPTALEDYYRCPYRWFTSRRVGYNSLDASFGQSARGTLAHGVLESFYRTLRERGTARVTSENLDEALELAGQVFDAYVEEHSAQGARDMLLIHSQRDVLACAQTREQVLELVERDASFLPDFEPTYFEVELGRSETGPLMYAGVPVQGKVDRIDVDGSGHAVIIDYKLAKLSDGYGLDTPGELPGRIQTDIYATLVERAFAAQDTPVEVVGSVYRSYAGNILRGVYASGLDWGKVEQVRAAKDALPATDDAGGYAAYLERVEQTVAACIQRLGAGDIAPQPLTEDTCNYCRALSFCPKAQASTWA